MGTTCSLAWRNSADTELVWTVAPGAPDHRRACRSRSSSTSRRCTASTSTSPQPDEQIFLSTFTGGEVFRSGCSWRRGKGQGLLLLPGRPGVPGLPPPRHQAGAGQRRALGGSAAAASTSPPPAVVNEPAPALRGPARRRGGLGMSATSDRRRCGPASIGLGWAGQQHMAAYADAARRRAGRAGRHGGRPAGRCSATSTASPPSTGSPTGRSWSAADCVDVVSVATPTTLHAPIAVAALDAGLHVLSREADGRERRRSAQADGRRRPPQRPGAGRLVQPPPSRRRPGAEEDHRRRRARATSTTPRPAGCAARASRAWAAGSPGRRRPAAAR